MGVDLGSSGVKAILLSIDRGIIASSSKEVALYSMNTGWAEADPQDWWIGLCALVPQLLEIAEAKSEDIKAVSVSGMVPAVLVLDENRKPLRHAILQNDARAISEIEELRNALVGVDLLAQTGSILTQQSIAPTALWLARNESDVWSQTRYVVGSYDWLAIALGADVHVEGNWARESGLYDFSDQPLDVVLSATKVSWPELSHVRAPGAIVGTVDLEAALATGLQIGTPIVVGGADHVLSAFGAGLLNNGDCLIKLGGAGDILAVSDEKFLDPRLYLDAHPTPGKWMPNGCMATSGSLLRWEQNIFGSVGLGELDELARVSTPGALITLPFFLGEKSPLHDANLRGVIAGLHLGTSRGDIHRSLLEAIAYGFRHHLEVFSERGLVLNNPRVTNGGSKSTLWKEILADVLDRELVPIQGHPGASFGAAVIAAIGVGSVSDWSFVLGFLPQGEPIVPNPPNRAIYDERFMQYKELIVQTTATSHALARGSE
ncbi:MAG: carbohydrate kinase [Actinobacteria bacterium]|nr:carbohydrate kinase [Actinomycetota bacterium]